MSRLRIVSLQYYLELPEEVQEKYDYVHEDVIYNAYKKAGISIVHSANLLNPNTLILTCHHRYLTDEDAAFIIQLINTSEEYKFPC